VGFAALIRLNSMVLAGGGTFSFGYNALGSP
jgi:hypothetical protein